MNEIFNTYLDADFLSFVGDFMPLAVAGLLLGICFYLLGWFVGWVITLVRTAL